MHHKDLSEITRSYTCFFIVLCYLVPIATKCKICQIKNCDTDMLRRSKEEKGELVSSSISNTMLGGLSLPFHLF